MLPRRKDPGEQVEDYADEPPDRDAPDLHRPEGGQSLRERDGDGAPGLRRGRGKLVGAEHARVGDEQPEAQHAHEGSHEDAGELGDELLAGVGAQEIAALEVGEEIGAAPRRGGRDVGGHQVHVHVARAQGAEDELGDLPHRAHRRGIRLARHAAGDQGQGEGQQHGHRRLPVRHAEGLVAEPGEPEESHHLAGDKPRASGS